MPDKLNPEEPTLLPHSEASTQVDAWRSLNEELFITTSPDGGYAPSKIFNPQAAIEVVDKAIELFVNSNEADAKDLAKFGLENIFKLLISNKTSLGPIWTQLNDLMAKNDIQELKAIWQSLSKEQNMKSEQDFNATQVDSELQATLNRIARRSDLTMWIGVNNEFAPMQKITNEGRESSIPTFYLDKYLQVFKWALQFVEETKVPREIPTVIEGFTMCLIEGKNIVDSQLSQEQIDAMYENLELVVKTNSKFGELLTSFENRFKPTKKNRQYV